MEPLEFSVHKIMSSTNRQFYFFFSGMNIFYFFSCLIALVKTLSTMPNKCGENEHPCLFLVPVGKLSTFHHCVWSSLGIAICSFYYVEEWHTLYFSILVISAYLCLCTKKNSTSQKGLHSCTVAGNVNWEAILEVSINIPQNVKK